MTGLQMGESTTRRPMRSKAGKWRTSSRCQNGECVEVRHLGGLVMVRNSAHPEHVIAVSEALWPLFMAALKAGEFDLPS
jgi:hypothetical protein